MFFEIKNLRVRYEGAEVVKGVSLHLEEGEIVTLIGSNGAGKTTILRAVSGLKAPSAGEIWFEGTRVDGRNAQSIVKLGIVQVPQGRGLFPYMSVAENLKLGAFLRKDRRAVQKDLADVLVHFPRLKERARQQASTLSGGEQQMLAIAAAVMCRPRLLLLDEPSMGLSPLMVSEIGKIVREINATGTTVLLVEQNSRLALKLATRAYVLETGNIVVEGAADELMHSEHVRKAYLGE
ncbi:MAG: ABC transporter ATP-binding protein [Actinomycetia bacterium]|nr:ABC transporter ATP-binding protein [Actinomycetes bacterium]